VIIIFGVLVLLLDELQKKRLRSAHNMAVAQTTSGSAFPHNICGSFT